MHGYWGGGWEHTQASILTVGMVLWDKSLNGSVSSQKSQMILVAWF